jgi:SAM-dependent methyltransferase
MPPKKQPERDPVISALRQALACGSSPGREEDDGPARTPTGADAQRLTHGFHTWPAGLHPDAAAGLLSLLPPGAVLDPFCGGGTVLVEAMLAGRQAIGRDLSPIATRVARLRTGLVDAETLTAFRSAARKATAAARGAEELPNAERMSALERWYEPHVLKELEALRYATAKSAREIRWLMEGCLSSIVIKASMRQSDTRARRVGHHRPLGTTAVLFHKKARELARRLEALREAVPEGTPASDIREADARELKLHAPVAGVLCSPPYPGVYDYMSMQHLRHVWLGLKVPQARKELGSRRAFKGDNHEARRLWRRDTEKWMGAAVEALQPGGRLIVVIGDGQVGPKIIGTAEPTMAAAEALGMRLIGRASVTLPATRPARQEHALAFEKPADEA